MRSHRLPARYDEPWREAFDRRVAAALVPGVKILDVGSGRSPTIPEVSRPSGCRYVGLDLSRVELDAAPVGSYDETYAADVTCRVSELEGQFDLAVSWQVLEHVQPLTQAIENIRTYLKSDGLFVAQLSGGRSLFGLVNRILPHKLGVEGMRVLLQRDPQTVFPAYYDRCTYGGLVEAMSEWNAVTVTPRYRGAGYFNFFGPAQAVYILFESTLEKRSARQWATHYLIEARK